MPVYKQKNSDNWLIEFSINGKRYRRSSQTPSKTKARQVEALWRKDIAAQKFAPAEHEPMTLHDAVDRFIVTNVNLRTCREKTKKAEIYTLKRITKDLRGTTLLDEITAHRVSSWRDRLIKQGLATGSVNRYLSTLRSLLNTAHRDWGRLGAVPTIKTMACHNERTCSITWEEEQRLLEVAPPHLARLIVFLVDTGARLSEATGLRWDDIQRQDDGVWRVVFKETKNNQPRSIPLTERLMSLLQSMEANNNRHAELVFTYRNSPNQSAVALNNPFTAWKTAVKRAGLNKELRIHDLRHTFASRLVTAGVPIYDVSKLLGHRSLSMTSRYAHLAPEAFFSAIKTLNRPNEL